MKIGLFGNSYWARMLAQQLKAEGINAVNILVDEDNNLRNVSLYQWIKKSELKKIDIFHVLGHFYIPKFWWYAKLFRKRTICHWIGSDVLSILASPRWQKVDGFFLNTLVDCHIANSDYLIKELQPIGINAERLPLVPMNLNVNVTPFPKTFTILSYWSNGRSKFYGSDIVLKLAEEFKNDNFLIVGARGKKESCLPNVKFLSWVSDMNEVYKKTVVLIRIPSHDGGCPLMVLEALARERQVIYSYKFPYCYYARSYKEVKGALLEIKRNPVLNYKGSKYVKENFNQKKIIGELIKIYSRLL